MTAMAGTDQRQPLAFHCDRSVAVWLVPGLLIAALTFNIAALKFPFLGVRVFPADTESYSIPHTIQLMWTQKLYLIAVLIAGFSLFFPFVKLTLLWVAWYVPMRHRTRDRVLGILGGLGKWSLLDVFVALVLIVLAHDQGTLFVTGVEVGLGLFMAAIVLAMIAGDLMHFVHDRVDEGDEPRRPARIRGRWMVHLVPLFAVGAAASYLAAIAAPYLQITAWYLNDHKYSILQTVGTLFNDRQFTFALAVACFLVLVPGLRIVWIMLAWGLRNRPGPLRRTLGGLRLIRRWSMLDVFGLAIGLFLLEGSNLVPIEHRPGVWMIVVAVAANMLLARAAGMLAYQALPGSSQEEPDQATAGDAQRA